MFTRNRKARGFYITTLLVFLVFPYIAFAQERFEPKILRRVHSEKIREIKLEKAVYAIIGDSEDEETRYYYNRVDLNDDNTPEVLVYISGRSICGTSGCHALLFRKVKGKYELITHFGPARNSIIVSQTKTNGWRDLIFYNVGGGNMSGYYSLCRFDGQTYPSNPTDERDAPSLKTRLKGVAYIAENKLSSTGFRL